MIDTCCTDFDRARERGTVDAGYGQLAYRAFDEGPWFIGCDLAPLRFCPWCGAAVNTDTASAETKEGTG